MKLLMNLFTSHPCEKERDIPIKLPLSAPFSPAAPISSLPKLDSSPPPHTSQLPMTRGIQPHENKEQCHRLCAPVCVGVCLLFFFIL